VKWSEAPLLYEFNLARFLVREKRSFWSNQELDMGSRCPCIGVTMGQIKSLPYTIKKDGHYEAYGCWLFATSEKIKEVA